MGVDEDASAAPLRRGSRIKRPATRYIPDSMPDSTAHAVSRKRGHRGSQGHDAAKRTRASKSVNNEAEAEGVKEEGGEVGDNDEDEDDDEDNSVYCICRQGNDGSPMICCSHCGEWYHFRCVGLSKRAADQIQEYVCDECNKAEQAPQKQAEQDPEYQHPENEKGEEEEHYNHRSMDADARIELAGDDAVDPQPSSDGVDDDASDQGTATHSRAGSHKYQRSTSSSTKNAARTTVSGQDPVRKHVLTTFTSIFEPLFSAKNAEPTKPHEYASQLEAELFRVYGQDPALRAYKEKFRSLLFNVKDHRNTSLHERITSGNLPAADIVHMSNEALANDTIREATEKAKRDALHQAVLRDQANGPARKITHKGEVDIERDASMSFAPGDMGLSTSTTIHTGPEPSTSSTNEHVTLSAPGSASVASDTSGSNDSFEKPNVAASTHRSDQSDQRVPISPSRTPSQDGTDVLVPPEPISFSGVWDTSQRQQHTETSTNSNYDIEPTNFAAADGSSEFGLEADAQADTCIDSFLDHEQPEAASEAHTPPGTPPPDAFVVRASQAASKSPIDHCPVVWDGVITMPEYTSAYVHARQLTEPTFAVDAPVWQDFFPTQERVVEGRLPSQTAIDYLLQVRLSPRNTMVVLLVDAGGATAASERHTSTVSTLHGSPALDKLVHYFADKQRFGVLTPAPGAQGSLVKDFYIAPLLSHMPVPEWLKQIHPEGLGEAWDAQRPANVLLVVLVLFKSALEGRTKVVDTPSAPPHPRSIEQSVQPVSLDALLNVKPDAIQNLLSTLSGSASPGTTGVPPVVPAMPGVPLGAPSPLTPPGPAPISSPPGPVSGAPPLARPMRPWGGVVRDQTPSSHGYVTPIQPGLLPVGGTAVPPPMDMGFRPFPVGPGGWYGGNVDRTKDKSRRRGGDRGGGGSVSSGSRRGGARR